ncbi:MAG TPA: hypothetical protein VJP79_01390 [Nitrososphaera sp.]|nr:hypothetical protein [Nitrososphaera sp.]
MTPLAFAVGADLVLGPVPAAAHQPVLAATADRTVPDLFLFVHMHEVV